MVIIIFIIIIPAPQLFPAGSWTLGMAQSTGHRPFVSPDLCHSPQLLSGHLPHMATVMGQIVYPPIIEVLTLPLMPHNVNIFRDRASKEAVKVNEVVQGVSDPTG